VGCAKRQKEHVAKGLISISNFERTARQTKYILRTYYRHRHSKIHTYTHPYKYTRISYLYENIREAEPAGLEMDEVTTCPSLSMETLSPTEIKFHH
jgi:hypothetical protein